MFATVDWNQVVATAASAVVVIGFLAAVMYKLAKTVIEKTITEVVDPAIESVNEKQAITMQKILDLIGDMQSQIRDNTADIAYLKGVREGEKQEVQRQQVSGTSG